MTDFVVARCTYCTKPVDPNSRYTYTRVMGWDRPGKAGGSDISLRERLEVFACPTCIERIRSGVNPAQEAFV